MPRRSRHSRGYLGLTLATAMEQRGLTPQQVAAAARIHKGTLYKILTAETKIPHHSTLRKICKVLELDIASLIGAEQLELISQKVVENRASGQLAELLSVEIATFGEQRVAAAEICVLAIIEVNLGIGRGADSSYYRQLRTSRESDVDTLGIIKAQLDAIHPAVRLEAVRQALGALIDLRAMSGVTLGTETLGSIDRLRNRHWIPTETAKRKAPGPVSLTTSAQTKAG